MNKKRCRLCKRYEGKDGEGGWVHFFSEPPDLCSDCVGMGDELRQYGIRVIVYRLEQLETKAIDNPEPTE